MSEQFTNLANTTLNGSLTAIVTSVVVTSAANFPTQGNFRVVVDSELMLVTAVSGTTFTVTRGIEGSTAATHATLAVIAHIVTAASLQTTGGYPCNGRLTLTSGTAVTTADVTGTTVYFTPYNGNKIALYTNSNWQLYNLTEKSIAVDTIPFIVKDVFIYDNAGALTLEHVSWNQISKTITGATNAIPIVITATAHGFSNGDRIGIMGIFGNTAANNIVWTIGSVTTNTFTLLGSVGNGTYTSGGVAYTMPNTRATALVSQDGVLCKSGDTTRRYVGTYSTTGSGVQTEDSMTKRVVWNYYNRVRKICRMQENISSWTSTNTTYHIPNNDPATRIVNVVGVAEDTIDLSVLGKGSCSVPSTMAVALGEDSLTPSANCIGRGCNDQVGGTVIQPTARLCDMPGIGYHFYQWLEAASSAGTQTWYGQTSGGGDFTDFSGIIGHVNC